VAPPSWHSTGSSAKCTGARRQRPAYHGPVTRSVRKVVIPAAGLGTRFLPATKSQPKEMLPVVDKPAIQYVVEEAVRAGIRDVLIITGRGKRTLEDHFDRSFELEAELESKGKHDLLDEVRAIADMADIHYVRQGEAKGLGHAVSVARQHVGNEPFVVMLGDDIMDAKSDVLEQMLSVYGRYGRSVVALKEVARHEVSSYGCVRPEVVEEGLVRLLGIVEKPPAEGAPSNLAVMGRYVFTPEIFDALDRIEPGAGGELQLTDAIALLLEEQTVYGYVFEDGRYDIGNKLDYLRATVELAIERDDVGPPFRAFLADLVERKKLI
jgi:UTP--glucose-1-phosphate uridylyltransferase